MKDYAQEYWDSLSDGEMEGMYKDQPDEAVDKFEAWLIVEGYLQLGL